MSARRSLAALAIAVLLPAAAHAASAAPAPAWPETPDPASPACAPARIAFVERALQATASPPGAVLVSACRAWPARPGVQLFAIAFRDPQPERIQLVVGLVPARDNRTPAWHVRLLEEDATLDGAQLRLRLDTARYALKTGVAGFGVDLFGGVLPNCADRTPGAVRSLYAWQAGTVRPVLQDVLLSASGIVAGDRGRCGNEGGGATVTEEMRATLALGPAAGDGWRDVVVTETRRRDDTPSTVQRRTVRYRFDGQLYRRD